MKKSQHVILSAVMLATIASCSNKKEEWTSGNDTNGHTRDTSVYRDGRYHYYRYYGGGWFPLYRNNMIHPGAFEPASSAEISRPSFVPRAATGGVHTGGFGSSAHSSAGE